MSPFLFPIWRRDVWQQKRVINDLKRDAMSCHKVCTASGVLLASERMRFLFGSENKLCIVFLVENPTGSDRLKND